MMLCDERETWLTNAEMLVEELEESLVKRGYTVTLNKPGGNKYILHVYMEDSEKALIVVEKEARSFKHLSPLDKYMEPYALKITIKSEDRLCSLLKLLLMKGGG